MKKIVKKITMLMLIFAVVGTTITSKEVSAVSNQSQAKKCLNKASKDCKAVMDKIYSSWYFQVYEDYTATAVVGFYAKDVGIPKSTVKKIIKKKYGETDWAGQAACIQVLSTNLDIVHTYFKDKGTFKKINKNLTNAKKYVKKLSGSQKNKYIKYYNAVNRYYKFVNNPSGSFSSLEEKMDSLNSSIDDAKDALSW